MALFDTDDLDEGCGLASGFGAGLAGDLTVGFGADFDTVLVDGRDAVLGFEASVAFRAALTRAAFSSAESSSYLSGESP